MIDKDQLGGNDEGQENNEDKNDEGKQGENWRERFSGLSRKFTETQNELSGLKTANEQLMQRLDEIASSLANPDDTETEAETDDPLEFITQKVTTLEETLAQERADRQRAELERQRTELFAEYGLTDLQDILAKPDDMEKQEEILKTFASKQKEIAEDEKKKRSSPPKQKKPFPDGDTSRTDLEALKTAMDEAVMSGSKDKLMAARNAYYAALDKTVDEKWRFKG